MIDVVEYLPWEVFDDRDDGSCALCAGSGNLIYCPEESCWQAGYCRHGNDDWCNCKWDRIEKQGY